MQFSKEALFVFDMFENVENSCCRESRRFKLRGRQSRADYSRNRSVPGVACACLAGLDEHGIETAIDQRARDNSIAASNVINGSGWDKPLDHCAHTRIAMTKPERSFLELEADVVSILEIRDRLAIRCIPDAVVSPLEIRAEAVKVACHRCCGIYGHLS
jgi:hypothetical protein